MSEDRLTHLDEAGKARMVDIGGKSETAREAVAEGFVAMAPDTLALIRAEDIEKGDVIQIARIAGMMGAKQTADLIPLCHPIPLAAVALDIEAEADGLRVVATCRSQGRTGVEMEALTAVSVACLTIYDMAKAVQRDMRIEGIRLLRKSGGKSGDWEAEP